MTGIGITLSLPLKLIIKFLILSLLSIFLPPITYNCIPIGSVSTNYSKLFFYYYIFIAQTFNNSFNVFLAHKCQSLFHFIVCYSIPSFFILFCNTQLNLFKYFCIFMYYLFFYFFLIILIIFIY